MSHKEHDTSGTNRRTILKVGALASVGGIVGGAGLTTAQSESEESDEAVEVTVLDADTGEPIEGAVVTGTCFFSTGEDGEGTVGDEGEIRETNEDGVAHLTLPPQGDDGGYNSCSYEVMAEGYEGVDRSLDLDNLEDQTVELTPTEDGEGGSDGETHTLTVVVTDTDGVRLEGLDVDVNTYEAGEDVAEGTTDDCGEVQFEVEDGGYEVGASHDELAQSTANMGVSVDEDVVYIINLFDTDDDEYEDPEDGRNITEPEPCEDAEVAPGDGDNTGDGDGSGDTDDTDDAGQDDQADEDATDDDSESDDSAGATDGDDPSPNTDRADDPDEDEDIPSSEELADRTSESYESESTSDDDCPKN